MPKPALPAKGHGLPAMAHNLMPDGSGPGSTVTKEGNNPMVCLSYRQPWANLVLTKEKRVETRGMNYTVLAGRWHAIHASSTWSLEQRRLMETEPFKSRLAYHGVTAGNAVHSNMPRGALVGVAFVSIIEPTIAASISDQERAFGNYDKGRWAYHLGDVFPLAEPILYTGRLGVWHLPPAIERKLMIGLQLQDGQLPDDLTSEDLLNEAVNQARERRLRQQQAEDTVARANRVLNRDTRTPIERMIDKAVGRG